jgi:5-oxoprolinase (ATP-hydrolysing)
LLKNSEEEFMESCEGTRNLSDNLADLHAQIAANRKGITLIESLIEQ